MAMIRELLRSLGKKPATRRYPFEKSEVPPGLRGKLAYDMVKCIGCGLCERDCPAGAIKMIGKGKTSEFEVYLDRCTFCSQCEYVCPVDAITMTTEFELAGFSKQDLTLKFKRPRMEAPPPQPSA
jgi:formate hydrogenlyase subunit 6/NADH:ubiquinone oxidoreductase subunit I